MLNEIESIGISNREQGILNAEVGSNYYSVFRVRHFYLILNLKVSCTGEIAKSGNCKKCFHISVDQLKFKIAACRVQKKMY